MKYSCVFLYRYPMKPFTKQLQLTCLYDEVKRRISENKNRWRRIIGRGICSKTIMFQLKRPWIQLQPIMIPWRIFPFWVRTLFPVTLLSHIHMHPPPPPRTQITHSHRGRPSVPYRATSKLQNLPGTTAYIQNISFLTFHTNIFLYNISFFNVIPLKTPSTCLLWNPCSFLYSIDQLRSYFFLGCLFDTDTGTNMGGVLIPQNICYMLPNLV